MSPCACNTVDQFVDSLLNGNGVLRRPGEHRFLVAKASCFRCCHAILQVPVPVPIIWRRSTLRSGSALAMDSRCCLPVATALIKLNSGATMSAGI